MAQPKIRHSASWGSHPRKVRCWASPLPLRKDSLGVSCRESQEGGRRFSRAKFVPVDRERLTQSGSIREIMDGWLLSSNPIEHGPLFRDGICARIVDGRPGRHGWRIRVAIERFNWVRDSFSVE